HHIAFLTPLTVGPMNDDRPLKDDRCVVEGNVPLAKRLFALVRIPIEFANILQQPQKFFFRHSEALPEGGCEKLFTAEGSL
ncbi:MAG TPA: hypothetical protein VE224_05860, partial [Pseudolabrys sp.]|nr:hypothetical protein [Pseudolabrys sp.]